MYVGNRRPIVGPGNARDHIVEQLNPVPTWGREFYTIPIQVCYKTSFKTYLSMFCNVSISREGHVINNGNGVVFFLLQREGSKGSLRGDIFRVIASEDNTVLSIQSNGPAVSKHHQSCFDLLWLT